MKEKPILMSGEMVKAILDGRKTQTRRLMKPQPSNEKINEKPFEVDKEEIKARYRPNGELEGFWLYGYRGIKMQGKRFIPIREIKSPYGQPGDRLWVRETWAEGETSAEIYYRATDKEITQEERLEGMCWRPSIHMPRWASRITLEITAVRVERVQEISEEDIKAEGVEDIYCTKCLSSLNPRDFCTCPETLFKNLWNSLYPGSWERNDWVWVYEFKLIKEG